jgi:NADPH2:quinone reductase
MRKRALVVGTVLRPRSIEEKAEAIRRFADDVLPLVRRGLIRPVIDAVYRAEEVRLAHEHLESNRAVGKIVLTFS